MSIIPILQMRKARYRETESGARSRGPRVCALHAAPHPQRSAWHTGTLGPCRHAASTPARPARTHTLTPWIPARRRERTTPRRRGAGGLGGWHSCLLVQNCPPRPVHEWEPQLPQCRRPLRSPRHLVRQVGPIDPFGSVGETEAQSHAGKWAGPGCVLQRTDRTLASPPREPASSHRQAG